MPRTQVQRLNAVGSREAIEELFDRFDDDMSGRISYEEFASELLRSNTRDSNATATYAKTTPPWMPSPTVTSSWTGNNTLTKQRNDPRINRSATTKAQRQKSEVSQSVLEEVKAALQARAGKNVGVRGCARLLRSMDSDGSKSLSRDELVEGMAELGVRLNAGDATKVTQSHALRKGSTNDRLQADVVWIVC
jgi:hypothetical protein